MKSRKYILLVGAVAALTACAKGNGISLAPYHDTHAWPGEFKLCHGFSCSNKSLVKLDNGQWNRVAAIFKNEAKTPEQEREQITLAIAVLEEEAVKAAKLKPDLGEAETFESDESQMDCIDETVNTSQYLAFLEDAGFLDYHDPAPPLHRGFFVDGMWPHNSAAVKEEASGEVYAIDSYYFDNGKPAAAVPIDVWLDEWRPENLPPRRRS